MLARDIDKKLDMECKLVLNKSDRAFDLSRNLNKTFRCAANIAGTERFLTVLFGSSKNEFPIISNMAASPFRERKGKLVANVRMEDSIYELLSELVEVRSVSTFNLLVEEGYLTARFRFHHNFLPGISRVLQGYNLLKHHVKDITIASSEGFISQLDRRNLEAPLFILGVDAPMSAVNNDEEISILKNGGIGELAGDISPSTFYSFIYYSTSRAKGELDVIDRDAFIYERRVTDETINVLMRMLRDASIKPYLIIYKANGELLRLYLLVDKSDAMTVISGGLRLTSKLEFEFGLSLSMDYSSSVWEWI